MTDVGTEGLATQWAVIALINALNKSDGAHIVSAAKEEVLSQLGLLGDRPGINADELRKSLENIFAQAGK
ncbi:hypothetical protein [Pseudomonas prosekii]|uniref:Uncharacterized protein n=1 Tax=Pseudomonas prosekii TaxID=1148509 RepID=A0A1H2B2J9_9PSED|nr:hypothetical protein [Pseudomonas prosekii]SDT52475.1 hypothetical protein SAMN05216222_4880 [Pseudomonas prosekii]